MIPRRYLLLGLGAVIAVLASLWGVGSCRRGQGTAAEHQAAIHQGEANAHQTQAQASDKVVEDLKAKLASHEADLGRLNAERNVLLRKLAAKPVPNPDPAVPGQTVSDPVVDVRDEVIAKDAELITAQAETITNQAQIIAVLTVSRDEWKKTAEAREKQALAQEAATRAWKQAVVTSKWRGRVEGFAAGVALGYVGGRR